MDSKKEIIMKKLLLILALIPLFAMGQEKEIVKEYCLVALEESRLAIWEFKQKPRTALIMMDDAPDPFYIANRNGERIKFNNTIHLINYMSKQGWEFHSMRSTPSKDIAHTECLFWRYKEINTNGSGGN